MAADRLIIHDLFDIRGGGERLVLTAAQGLHADLLFGAHSPESFDLSGLATRAINLNVNVSTTGLKTWRLARAFGGLQLDTRAYRNVIYSGVVSPLAVHRCTHAHNLMYCHTPPRFVYDKRAHYRSQLGPLQALAMDALVRWFKPRYERALRAMDAVLSNSHFVQQRLRDHLGLDSAVVHPPCDTERFVFKDYEDFYLSTARLDPLKRVDRIVRVFLKHPDKRLVVASGGPQRAALEKLAAGAPNIHFTGWLSEAALQDLLGRCLATIYLPEDEDFGMSPLESMAAGKPVLCSDHGGPTESVIDGVTGFYLSEDDLEGALTACIGRLDAARAARMRSDCEARAAQFDRARFIEAMCEYLHS